MTRFLGPLLGLLVAGGLAIVAILSPDASYASPMLTGAVAGGIVSLALFGVVFGRSNPASGGPEIANPAELSDRLSRIDEHVMLSDGAKKLLYRDRELDLVRMMMEQDIAAGDHDAALRLVDELGTQFGRLEEAERNRTRIDSLRQAEVERRIAEGLQTIRRLLARSDWAGATQAADRLHRLLPDAPGLDGLANQIASARTRHSIEIETQMRDAHAEGRIDDAMRLLRELDRHLISGESSRVVDVAQAIIVSHRDLIGHRFRDAVSEKRWSASLELGESITRDYPNTRMAEEVAELLPTLRQRATGGPPAATHREGASGPTADDT